MTSPYLDRPRRPLWKALADTGRADYFRWTFLATNGREYVLSVGKAHGPKDGLKHAASKDTAEVLLWCKDTPRRDLWPEDIGISLHPWQRFFTGEGGPIALHMPDSIVTSLVFGLGHYMDQVYFGHALLNSLFYRTAKS